MPRHQRYWVGLDAGHLETAVCLVDAEGHVFFEAMTETRAAPIRDILRRFGVEPVQSITIEAGVGTQMVRDLRSFGLPVQVVDVRKSSKFLAIRRHKTDANDARGLAELGRVAQSMGPQVFVKPVEHQDIRIMINIRRTLLKQRARTDALLQSIFRLHGANIKLLNGRGSLAAEVASQLRLLRTGGVTIRVDLDPLVSMGEALRSHISNIDREMRTMATSIPACARFQGRVRQGGVISAVAVGHRQAALAVMCRG